MALIRRSNEGDLHSQLSRMQREMDRLMTAFSPWQEGFNWPLSRAQVYPALNIYNDGESYIVRAEVPGVDPKSLDIEVVGNTLTLKGERKLPELKEKSSYHRRERDFGQFRRSLSLPDRVDNTKVMATCHDGILEVRLPHAEETKARKITVKSS